MRILDLPKEVVIRLLRLVEGADIARVSSTCSVSRAIVQESTELRYMLELAICGYRDMFENSPEGSLKTSAERLEILQAHTAAWKNFTPTRSTPIESFPQREAMAEGFHDLQGHLFYTLNYMEDAKKLQLDMLPSAFRMENLQHWSIDLDVPHQWQFYVVDSYQNLLVIVQSDQTSLWYIELRDLLDGGPHPSARNSILHIPRGRGRMSDTACQVIDNVLGCYVSTGSYDKILILDWIEGTTVASITIDEPDGPDVSYTFLSNSIILVASNSRFSLDVYSFPRRPSSGSSEKQLDPVSCYLFLQLVEGVSIDSFGWDSQPPAASEISSRPLSQQITMATLRLESSSDRESFKASVFIDPQDFIHCPVENDDGPRMFSWDEWGPTRTRWIDESDGGCTRLFGGNLAVHYTDHTENGRTPSILDFHRQLYQIINQPNSTHSSDTRTIHAMTEHSSIRNDKYFKSEIISHLPYREIIGSPWLNAQIFVSPEVIVHGNRSVVSGSETDIMEFTAMTM